jgi:two-component system, OmpR family, sensor kinase
MSETPPAAEPRRARVGRLQRVSLRARLVAGLIAVVLVGLVAGNVIIFENIENYLIGGVDGQLLAAVPSVTQSFRFHQPITFNANIPNGTYGAAYTTTGLKVTDQNFSAPEPSLSDATVQALAKSAGGSSSGYSKYITVGSVGGDSSFEYRVVASSVVLTNNTTFQQVAGVAIVAIPLAPMNSTLHKLISVDLAVGAALLVLLGLLGYFVVRVGLRPLGDIEETAGAIAAGDLSRRVDRVESSTEVGRLGASLNVMLETIEHSFNEQRASENRLRQFLADASHELRTPVTSIRGYAELFRRGAAERPDDLATAMRRIEDESIRMGTLVDDLLLLARLDQGRPLELVPVDLALIVADGVSDAEVLAPEREVVLEVEGPLRVLGDEQRLRQVVGNLLQNAIRHTRAGTPITVKAGRRNDEVFLSVIDEGPGIAPEHLTHIFERFYRADPSRTRESGGAGLGLSIVASIVDSLGGKATATSTIGEGTTFTVTLPSAPDGWVPPPDREITRSSLGAPAEPSSSSADAPAI